MKYVVEVEHSDAGAIDVTFRDVGSSLEDRRRIAAALRVMADRVDPNNLAYLAAWCRRISREEGLDAR